MAETKRSAIVEEKFQRIVKHLPAQGELSLIALKGHLLVEELLGEIIAHHCREPKVLDTVEMGFYVKAKVVCALLGRLASGEIWGLSHKLNSIRNDYGHHLESQTVNTKIMEFVELKCHYEGVAVPKPNSDEDFARLFSNSIAYLLGALAAVWEQSRELNEGRK